MKAAKECCRRTFCARSLIFMASASIIFWNELIKRTKTTADAVVFSIKMWRAQQRRLGRHQQDRTNPKQTEIRLYFYKMGRAAADNRSKPNCIAAKNSRHPIPQAEQLFKPKPRNGGVKGQSPLCSLGGFKGPFSHVREWPPYPVQRLRRCFPCLWHKKELPLPRELFFVIF